MKRWEQRIDEARERRFLGVIRYPRFTREERDLASNWATCAVGEMRHRYGVRMDRKNPPELRAGATPRTQADKPVGEWNRFEITVRGKTVTVALNGKTVIPTYQLPSLPERGPVALQHHGSKRGDQWTSPPALMQFKNIFIKELK